MYRHTVTVAGPGAFPKDMLRYDELEPATDEDREKIETRASTDAPAPVTLVRTHERADWTPTEGRWSSFLWGVREHKVERVKVTT